MPLKILFFSGCDCSHVTASNQSGHVATVSCSQSAASLQTTLSSLQRSCWYVTADCGYPPWLVACGHVSTVEARKNRTFRGILVVYYIRSCLRCLPTQKRKKKQKKNVISATNATVWMKNVLICSVMPDNEIFTADDRYRWWRIFYLDNRYRWHQIFYLDDR